MSLTMNETGHILFESVTLFVASKTTIPYLLNLI